MLKLVIVGFPLLVACKPSAYKPASTLELNSIVNRLLARADLNGDGRIDLVVGGDNADSNDKEPILALLNQGDGSFVDGTNTVFPDAPLAHAPLCTPGDFNEDGIVDFAIFDAGDGELGQHPEGGFFGSEPLLLLSDDDGAWELSTALQQAVEATSDEYCWPQCSSVTHAKSATTADVDGDGHLDMWVESGGGYENPNPHFLFGAGDGTFELDATNERRNDTLIWGNTGSWRHATGALLDVDGDEHLDLVLGQLRKRDNQQDELASKVILATDDARFLEENVTNLPYIDWNDGYTYVKTILVADLDEDGDSDLIFAHEHSNIDPDPDGVGNQGRFLQVLINEAGEFTDVTSSWLGAQTETLQTNHPEYGGNTAMPKKMALIDADDDGDDDLVMMDVWGPISNNSPWLYLRDGDTFTPQDPQSITGGETWVGMNVSPVDLNQDGLLDVTYFNLHPGPDGEYNTGDETTDVKTILAVQPN